MTDLRGLPARALVEQGLLDTRNGRTSIESLLVSIAAPRLQALGLEPYGEAGPLPEPELALYARLGVESDADPYSRYNALLRELSSFVRALEHRVTRERRLGEQS